LMLLMPSPSLLRSCAFGKRRLVLSSESVCVVLAEIDTQSGIQSPASHRRFKAFRVRANIRPTSIGPARDVDVNVAIAGAYEPDEIPLIVAS
ncbi:MAG: hypothetical protein PF636_09300, partial [Actinomycetota bacterium]|nr:hypothetical protein [Actinomycetota bacterium]